MAQHRRELIRKAVVTRLTDLATTGERVESWRTHALSVNEMPHLAIMPADDPEQVAGDIENEFGTMEVRDLPITVEARAIQMEDSGHSELADELDDICGEVEVAMLSDVKLGDLAVDSRLLSTELSIDGSGERPVGVARMIWLIRYEVDRADPTT